MRLIPSRRPRKRASTPELLSEKSGSSEFLRFVQCFRRNKERGITRQYRAPTRQAPPLSERQLGTPARYNMECIHTRRDQLSDHVPECTNHSRDSTSPNLHTQARKGEIFRASLVVYGHLQQAAVFNGAGAYLRATVPRSSLTPRALSRREPTKAHE